MNLRDIQESLAKHHVDAWVLYDFRGSNTLAWQMLDVPADAHCTRRWMVVIPAKGSPTKIVHRMEQGPLEHVSINSVVYDTGLSWSESVRETLAPYQTIAMEYSPMNELPVVSKVDAGTMDMMRSFEKNVVSSADLIQHYTAVLSEDQLAGAAVTGGLLRDIVFSAFNLVRTQLLSGGTINEYDVQQHILAEFERHNLETDSAPIVAIGPNASSPHYAPSYLEHSNIPTESVLVIDAWCKKRVPGATYADITWVGYTGVAVPAEIDRSFSIIADARNAALTLVAERFRASESVRGYEVDNACRNVVRDRGMASAFIHRTGHNITTEVHGPGANMDDFETHDTRVILPGTMFSIEPGIYIPGVLGLRTEIDVVVLHDGSVTVPSSPMQSSVLPLLSDDWKQ